LGVILEKSTMNKIIIIICFCLGFISCSRTNHDKNASNRFVKIAITDTSIRGVLKEYSNDYDFDGKGVIIANIDVDVDTTKCYVMLVLEKEFFDNWLKKKEFVLYDTVDNRIVILSTMLEPYFKITNQNSFADTILNKYLIHDDGGIYDIWEMEFSIAKDTIIKRVIYNKPIY
jgi:hypothetical protein